MMMIDKSIFSAEELAQYEALIAKAKVDPEAAEGEMEEEQPVFPPKKAKKAEVEDFEEGEEPDDAMKSASPEILAALKRLETLEKSFEMKEFAEIAKKYAALGENEEDLAATLYNMKKSSPANYNAYIEVLDKSLGIVEKSGLFAEIGKSNASAPVGAVAKAEAKAQEIMKNEPNTTYTDAIAKAWMDPAIMAEYDAEYKA